MQRRELLLRLATTASRAGATLVPVPNGGTPILYELDDLRVLIPRNREINEVTTDAILQQAQDHVGGRP